MTNETPVLGVSACLVRGGNVLLVERGRGAYAGRLSLPGGRVNSGEPLAAAIRREILEETGITADRLEFHRPHEAIAPGFHAVILVYRGWLPEGAAPVAGDDAAAVLLCPLADLAGLEEAGRTTPGLSGIVLQAFEALSR